MARGSSGIVAGLTAAAIGTVGFLAYQAHCGAVRKQADVVSDDADDIRSLFAAANAKTSILDL